MHSSDTPVRTARLGARVAQDVLNTLKRAAEIEGRSVSDFVIAAARSAAEQTIERAQLLRFSLADQERIADVLARPAAMPDALQRAQSAHRELIRESR